MRLRTFLRVFTFLVLLNSTAMSFAATEHVKGFNLRQCDRHKNCVVLKTSSAQRSALGPLYSFASAQLSVTNSLGTQFFKANDGYYDLESQTIVLRGVQNKSFKEMVYSLESGKMLKF